MDKGQRDGQGNERGVGVVTVTTAEVLLAPAVRWGMGSGVRSARGQRRPLGSVTEGAGTGAGSLGLVLG